MLDICRDAEETPMFCEIASLCGGWQLVRKLRCQQRISLNPKPSTLQPLTPQTQRYEPCQPLTTLQEPCQRNPHKDTLHIQAKGQTLDPKTLRPACAFLPGQGHRESSRLAPRKLSWRKRLSQMLAPPAIHGIV